MKTRILIAVLIAASVGITAHSFTDRSHTTYYNMQAPGCKNAGDIDLLESPQIGPDNKYRDFYYDMGTRFGPISKSELIKVTSVRDFFEEELIASIESYQSVSIARVVNDERTTDQKNGKDAQFTPDQISFLRSFDYSTNFVLQVDFQARSTTSGKLFNDYRSPHLTVVPEKMASYAAGKQALIDYLGSKNKELTKDLDQDRLQPAKLYFTVTSSGELGSIELGKSSGYPDIDENIIELLKNAPGSWIPAQNSNGEKVDQQLVISFGLIGC